MNTETTIAFCALFFLLAVTPGAGLAMILSRALGSGMAAGFAVTTGLVLGDFLFLGLAMLGLSTIATAMGPWFEVVKYLAGAYLLWLGYRAFTAKPEAIELQAQKPQALWRDVGMGFFVTLGNPKPLLFYGALLPTLLDMSNAAWSDFGTMALIVVGISYPVYGAYMLLIERARRAMLTGQTIKRLNQATGAMFVGSGAWVISR